MSKRMNKERAIEQLKKLIEFTKKAREVIGTPQKDIEIVIGENQFYLSDELLQALDIAIESLIKQSEYDMHTHNVEFQLKLAEKKLNELGYAFNEYRGCIIAIDKADKE